MIVDMKMPDLSTTDEDIVVVRWLVEVGGRVERGRPLLEVRTDKATMEVDSFVTGVLREVLAGPDAKVEAGQVIARVEAEGAAPASVSAAPAAPAAREAPPPAAPIAPAGAAQEARTGMFARNRQRAGRQAPAAPAAPISPPQVVAADGKIVVQRRIGLALAADHRVVGGRYAADFLGAIVAELEAL